MRKAGPSFVTFLDGGDCAEEGSLNAKREGGFFGPSCALLVYGRRGESEEGAHHGPAGAGLQVKGEAPCAARTALRCCGWSGMGGVRCSEGEERVSIAAGLGKRNEAMANTA